jgi:hypothetical protein
MQDAVVRQIDEQIQYLRRVRSLFPRLSTDLVGHTEFPTPPYYAYIGLGVWFRFSSPLTSEFITEFNDLAHWINQNFVLRLYAVLESNGLISQTIRIHPDIEGHDEVDILRRLRNSFGHGSGRYDPTDAEQRRLFERIVARFDLDVGEDREQEGKYPLSITEVLIPLAEGCRRYAASVAGTAQPDTAVDEDDSGGPSASRPCP